MKKWIILFVWMLAFAAAGCAETAYYINPDGGRYYHADGQCDAISEKYWKNLRQVSESKVIAELALSPCSRCCADQAGGTYTRVIGGKGPDQLYEIESLPGGGFLAVGNTRSSDGWLSDRSKSGKSGWATHISSEGLRNWNFCSRHSSNDCMMAPVAHADGTITVLLRSDGNDYNQIELIRLDESGAVVGRKTLMKFSQDEAHCALEWPAAFSGGYVVSRIDHHGPRKPIYTWFDFEGNVIRTSEGPHEGSLAAVSERHVIEVHEDAYWLCALDEAGNETKLHRLFDVKGSDRTYLDMVSLTDGGAAACGTHGSRDAYDGLITRFDESGQTEAEFFVSGYRLEHLLALDDGYAAAGRDALGACYLLRMDRSGEILSRQQLKGELAYEGQAMCKTADGRVAVVTNYWGEQTEDGMVNWEALLTVLDMQ